MRRYGLICPLRRVPSTARVVAKGGGPDVCSATKIHGEGGGRGPVPINCGRGTRERRHRGRHQATKRGLTSAGRATSQVAVSRQNRLSVSGTASSARPSTAAFRLRPFVGLRYGLALMAGLSRPVSERLPPMKTTAGLRGISEGIRPLGATSCPIPTSSPGPSSSGEAVGGPTPREKDSMRRLGPAI